MKIIQVMNKNSKKRLAEQKPLALPVKYGMRAILEPALPNKVMAM